MPGAGVISHMIQSLKFNDRRKKRTHFDKNDILDISKKTKTKVKFKTATKAQLLKIREDLKRKNQIYNRKLIGYTIITSVTLFLIIRIYFQVMF